MSEDNLADRRLDAYRMGRKRRGDIRIFLLWALEQRPMSGYDLIRFFAELTHEMWIPSPGSIYPTLQLLEEQGMVVGRDQDDKRVYEITQAGRDEAAALPKGTFEHEPEQLEAITHLREAGMQVKLLMKHLIMEGSVDQLSQAADILRMTEQQLAKLVGHEA